MGFQYQSLRTNGAKVELKYQNVHTDGTDKGSTTDNVE